MGRTSWGILGLFCPLPDPLADFRRFLRRMAQERVHEVVRPCRTVEGTGLIESKGPVAAGAFDGVAPQDQNAVCGHDTGSGRLDGVQDCGLTLHDLVYEGGELSLAASEIRDLRR